MRNKPVKNSQCTKLLESEKVLWFSFLVYLTKEDLLSTRIFLYNILKYPLVKQLLKNEGHLGPGEKKLKMRAICVFNWIENKEKK